MALQLETKPAVDAAVAGMLALFRRHRRGDTIPWPAVEAAAGIPIRSTHWTAAWRRTKRDFLRETGVEVWPFQGDGARLLTAAEQIHFSPGKRTRFALRHLTKSHRALSSLPDRDLTPHQRAAKHSRLDRVRSARRKVLYEAIQLGRTAAGTPSGLPRPVKPGA